MNSPVMSLSTYAPTCTPNYTPTTPSSVLFQGDVPPSVQRQIVEFSDFHLKDVDFARTTGQRLALKEASVFKRPEDGKLQSRLVYEITVAQGKHAFYSWLSYFHRTRFTQSPLSSGLWPSSLTSGPFIRRRYDKPATYAARRVRRVPRRRVSLCRPLHISDGPLTVGGP